MARNPSNGLARLEVTPTPTTEVICRECRKPFIGKGLRLDDGRTVTIAAVCDPCIERTTIAAAERGHRMAVAAQEAEAAQRLEALAVPPLFADATLAGVRLFGSDAQIDRTRRAVKWARRYLAQWPRPEDDLAVFAGAPGNGKTMVAWAIARAVVLEHGGTARVTKCGAMVKHIRGAWALKQDGEEVRRVKGYVAPDLLVIDEVSRHAFYGEPTQELYDVIDARVEACRPTILTSNESDEELAALLGRALMDRCALGGVVDFGEESYRRWKRQEGRG